MRGFQTPAGGQASTDTFQDVAFLTGPREQFKELPVDHEAVSIEVKNIGANSIDVQVIGKNVTTLPDADSKIVTGPTAVAAGAVLQLELNPFIYALMKVQIKATGAGSQGTFQGIGMMKGRLA